MSKKKCMFCNKEYKDKSPKRDEWVVQRGHFACPKHAAAYTMVWNKSHMEALEYALGCVNIARGDLMYRLKAYKERV